MKLNKAQIIIIVIFGCILALIALPNLILGGPRDRGILPIYPVIVGVCVIGVYLKRDKIKPN